MNGSFSLIALLILATSFAENHKITVFLIGDSTMSDKETKAYPETGWGMPFKYFFDSTVVVDNRAKNGRSTRSFLAEGRWQQVIEQMKEGDYVFIQFGHNDESKEKAERYASPPEYKKNLILFISETRARKGIPVLITPVARRKFKDGAIQETHAEYSPLVREVSESQHVPLIDLDMRSRELLQKFGEENSKLLFLQLQPGEHPNYPEGKNDNTHFNELGARLIAQIVLEDVVRLKLGLASHVVKPVKK